MKQQTLAMAADQGFEQYRKPTRRDQFLEAMNRIVPWEALCAVVKWLWGFTRVRDRGLAKNACRAFTALTLANIYLSRHRLMAQVRP
ncbi:hypothetical protein ASE07_26650 [Noviherbaspirillum sp. Root189]|nr:hypothetical protein ASE07_26650 [Noviherbaspirillum sp. Root189]